MMRFCVLACLLLPTIIEAESVAQPPKENPAKSDGGFINNIIPSSDEIKQYWNSRTTLQKYCIVAPQLIALTFAFIAYLAVSQDGQTEATLGEDAFLNGPNRDPKTNGHNRAVMYPGEENK